MENTHHIRCNEDTSTSSTRIMHPEPAVPGQRITYQLTPPRAPTSYYTKVVISDAVVCDLQLRSGDHILHSAPNSKQLEFPDHFKIRTGEISFTVTEVSPFGKSVINVHKFSTSFYNHWL